ncbi:regulator [Escherichia coli]|nr:regulator [Escherichia coli]
MGNLARPNDSHTVIMAMKSHFHNDDEHEKIRRAVRTWAHYIANQEVVANVIITEWFRIDGKTLSWPDSWANRRQKFFRWLDNDSEQARANIQRLKPAILAVLPTEYRKYILEKHEMIRVTLSDSMRTCGEAHRAVIMAAPNAQKVDAIAEAIAVLLDLSGELEGEVRKKVRDLRGYRA